MTRARKPQPRGDRTRERLLEAAASCLVEFGYHGTSTTKISERAGVSRGAQLHHFPNKRALLTATLRHIHFGRGARVRAALEAIEPGPDRAMKMIDLLWETMSDPNAFLPWQELVLGSRTDPELKRTVEELVREVRSDVDQQFAELFADGSLPPVASRLLWVVMDGLVVHRLSFRDDAREREILDTLKALARSMQKKAPSP